MPRGVEAAVVIGEDRARGELRDLAKAGGEFLGATVEEKGRAMRTKPVAGEKIAGKKKMEARAVKSAVALGVAGQMNDAQAAPPGQILARPERSVDLHSAISERPATGGLHEPAQAAGARIGEGAVDVPLLRRMGENGCAGELLQPRDIACVVEVTMGQQDGFDVRPAEPDFLQRPPQARELAYQPRVDENGLALTLVVEQMKRASVAANGIYAKPRFRRNIV